MPKTWGDLANIKQREGETLLAYLKRFKKIYVEIEGISQDKVITCFEGKFRSRMKFIKLQLQKPEPISEVISVAHKAALAKGSPQELQYKKKK